MSRGRPKILSQQSQKFLDLYLDPLMTVEQICFQCGIGKSTFYVYEKELNLPQLKVAVGSVDADLPRKNALSAFSLPEERLELDIIRHVGREIQARIKIIPVLSNDASSADDIINSKKVDFVISSLSKTKERAKNLYFSENYNLEDEPMGVLIRNPVFAGTRLLNQRKPTLGVLSPSVHSEYAEENLKSEYYVKHFRTAQRVFLDLQTGSLDFALFHPGWFELLPQETLGLEICSKPYRYNTHSAIVFHADSRQWIEPVNRAIEILHIQHLSSLKKS